MDWGFLSKILTIVSTTLIILTILCLIIGFPIGLISIGYKFYDSCPVEPKLPLFLITGGFLLSLHLLTFCKLAARGLDRHDIYMTHFERFTGYTSFFWFIIGCALICSSFQPNFIDQNSETFCHKTLYVTSILTLIIVWLVLTFGIYIFAYFATLPPYLTMADNEIYFVE